ncbi:WNK protein kinase, variant [Aphanomyces invadans]|uniref:WNK protein kinase, variant n=1 Tax=Aphanomyces invadans TaxID=157072 RepID=A0A024UWL6_9STRA|nr:WNK protein kinase, variant [Aphanomyces invadans]ETW10355.1 WNK protein kinase, variant [Aphanomyces invadans]|eukprot:XP_008861766.1 WNK protein kinase, variant [Aphanomyces invadans]
MKMEDGDKAVEQSPRGIYIRFDKRLGTGAYKTVYKAYDVDQGIDVAWNAIDIGALPHGEKARIIQEVELLKKLEHKNIINFYGSWFAKEKNQVVFITEIMTAGSLKSYIKRVHFVKWKIIKRWCLQILEGLHYLHSQNPPVIHRDLKCDNIFINGNTGDLRIGDLGLSTQMAVEKPRAQSVLGTPEFMAPELYDENYDEKVDIYAFGMCVLEMVTKEVPYSECQNPAQIYKKVMAGIRPQGLSRIKSQAAREFIELCLSRGDGQVDVTAKYLMGHSFLQPSADDDQMVECVELPAPIPPMSPPHKSLNGFDQDALNTAMAAARLEKRRGPQRIPVEVTAAPATLPEANDGSRSNSLIFTNRPTTDAPLSAGVIAANDKAADAILASMRDTEINHDSRKAVMDGRNNKLSDDKKFNLQQPPTIVGKAPLPPPLSDNSGLPRRKGSLSDGSALPPAPTSSPLPPMVPTISKKSSIGDNAPVRGVSAGAGLLQHQQPIYQAQTQPQPVAGAQPARKVGRRHEIRATKDPSAPHSILLSMRLTLNGKSKEIKFPFNVFTDSPHEIACELAEDVGIMEPDVGDIADSIGYLAIEGKLANLPEVDVDVWEEAPEPHSFSSKPLPHVFKMNLVPYATAPLELDFNDDLNASMLSTASSSSSRDLYHLGLDDNTLSSGPNSLSKQSSLQDDMGEWNTTTGQPNSSGSSSGSGGAGLVALPQLSPPLTRDSSGSFHAIGATGHIIDQTLQDEEWQHAKEMEKHDQEMEKYLKKIEELKLKRELQLNKMQQLHNDGDLSEQQAPQSAPPAAAAMSDLPSSQPGLAASSSWMSTPAATPDTMRKPMPVHPSVPPVVGITRPIQP